MEVVCYNPSMTRQYPKRPIFGVGAIVFKGNDVLLVRRGRPPGKGNWSLPGGAVELGESAKEALVREVREETGLEVVPEKLIAVVDIIGRDGDGAVRHHYAVADYRCGVASGTLKAGGDAAEARWVPLKDLKKYRLTPKAQEVILGSEPKP